MSGWKQSGLFPWEPNNVDFTKLEPSKIYSKDETDGINVGNSSEGHQVPMVSTGDYCDGAGSAPHQLHGEHHSQHNVQQQQQGHGGQRHLVPLFSTGDDCDGAGWPPHQLHGGHHSQYSVQQQQQGQGNHTVGGGEVQPRLQAQCVSPAPVSSPTS